MTKKIKIDVSSKHVHLSEEHFMMLFGTDRKLEKARDLSQPGAFLAHETVDIKSDNGKKLEKVRIIGPLRNETVVVVSKTEAKFLNMEVPVRNSKELDGTPGISLVGPYGEIKLKRDMIVARRHIHMSEDEARDLGLKHGDFVALKIEGERAATFEKVIVYAKKDAQFIAHIDEDEGNAVGITEHGEGEMMI